MNKKKGTKKYGKFLIIVFIIAICGLHIQPDDKELFMGENLLTTTPIKPNVIILLDSSGSMNTIVFYPKDGPDDIKDNEDDGYDPKAIYSGTVEDINLWEDLELSESKWYARWIVPSTFNPNVHNAKIYDREYFDDWDGTGKHFWTGCYAVDSTGTNFQCGNNGWNNFREGEKVMYVQDIAPFNRAVATIKRKYKDSSNNPWFELENIQGQTIVPYITVGEDYGYKKGHFQQAPDGEDMDAAIVYLYGIRDVWGSETQEEYEDVLYPPNYIKWMFNHANDAHREGIIYFSKYGTFNYKDAADHSIPPTGWDGPSTCDQGNGQDIRQTWTRIQVAKEVLCNVAKVSMNFVNMGIFRFDGAGYDEDTPGAIVEDQLWESSDVASDLTDFKGKMRAIKANTWTPLAESLADIWQYYKPGPGLNASYWPSDIEFADGNIANANSPIKHWCQNNFVIVMTDGTSTKDDFSGTKYEDSIFTDSDYPVKRESVWNSWTDGWGDTDNNDKSSGRPENYNQYSATYCPYYSCWTFGGTDYLDDVAYLLRHQDMFPDDIFVDAEGKTLWPGDQVIYTYVIGFAIDNDMLRETAANGEGGYYSANNYEQLSETLQNVLTSINLRSFAFSSITAPKKTATATDVELTVSYVGYFLPSGSAAIWEGHLLAYKLQDAWGYDSDNSGEVEFSEYIYDTQETCLGNSGTSECYRSIALSIGHEWDAADHLPAPDDRNLYTHDSSSSTPTDNIAFTDTNQATLRTLFDPTDTISETDSGGIINRIRGSRLADVFHSDVGFVGPPLYGKKFLTNINPTGSNDQTYDEFYTNNQTRRRVLFAGTNEGILHMFYADKTDAGKEVWGFIPDEVLPSLKTICMDLEHTYTVDGRISASDIYYARNNCPNSYDTCWSTVLVFGLRRGGNAYYGLDITTVNTTQPTLLWKFKDDTYSGESWGKPVIGRIKMLTSGSSPTEIEKWVAVLPGGFGFNSENSADQKGKAVFIVDASDGTLLWMIGYDAANGAADAANSPDPEILDTATTDDYITNLTKAGTFNFAIPSALNAVDKDGDGYLDTIYYGNLGGHLFKTDISNPARAQWTTRVLFEDYIEPIADSASETIDAIADNVITIKKVPVEFVPGATIMQVSPYAYGYIFSIDKTAVTVVTNTGTFQKDNTLVIRNYDPIYLSPALAYDTCYQLWVTFGTGDRDRPRSNPTKGRFIAFKDNGSSTHHIDGGDGDSNDTTLQQLNNQLWGVDDDTTVDNAGGWYFDFPDAAEKIFDPEPVIIPDQYLIPHIYFNTYQPPLGTVAKSTDLCSGPDEGIMKLYDIALVNCGTVEEIEGDRITGRIAGGGIYQGKEYVMYTSETGDVADVPGEEGGQFKAKPIRLPYPGGIVFWKEKKR